MAHIAWGGLLTMAVLVDLHRGRYILGYNKVIARFAKGMKVLSNHRYHRRYISIGKVMSCV